MNDIGLLIGAAVVARPRVFLVSGGGTVTVDADCRAVRRRTDCKGELKNPHRVEDDAKRR